ncbi:DUF4365 domain-containing protein [Paraflavitalea sp. CAU 1676]|uniref:DUF4365 domain-containing protein n=1 Tax=Paraflavitalea sp. CAU 1676 TaxID=3032598 RepID=UPI0023DB48B6|nr:DUF4365 domain-containing protein [Paraflavitalea sp. CAU 1676]MDF2192080.1 DUF4365 domain-containing protein [Paraflavitalea sp. CAU 1676]
MTQRHTNNIIEQQGVRFVQGVVQDNNSIFQPFSRENDQGNDCYIEFVRNGIATNFGVFAQIKSGKSHKDSLGYKIKAGNPHLQYWSQGLSLAIGIVYDHSIKKAFWVDITDYIKKKPEVLKQQYHNIRVDRVNEFTETTFADFLEYCFQYKNTYTNNERFGLALEWFANTSSPNICYEGLKALYSIHRERTATWLYIITSFSRIKEEPIRQTIIGLLSNYTNANIFWNAKNIEQLYQKNKLEDLRNIMSTCFRRNEIELVLPYMELGISRGSFSYLTFLVINMINDLHCVLKEIAFDSNVEEERRNFCFWLYMQISKFLSIDETLKTADEYFSKFPASVRDESLVGVKQSIEQGILWPVG